MDPCSSSLCVQGSTVYIHLGIEKKYKSTSIKPTAVVTFEKSDSEWWVRGGNIHFWFCVFLFCWLFMLSWFFLVFLLYVKMNKLKLRVVKWLARDFIQLSGKTRIQTQLCLTPSGPGAWWAWHVRGPNLQTCSWIETPAARSTRSRSRTQLRTLACKMLFTSVSTAGAARGWRAGEQDPGMLLRHRDGVGSRTQERVVTRSLTQLFQLIFIVHLLDVLKSSYFFQIQNWSSISLLFIHQV